jgi:hypothetical protein
VIISHHLPDQYKKYSKAAEAREAGGNLSKGSCNMSSHTKNEKSSLFIELIDSLLQSTEKFHSMCCVKCGRAHLKYFNFQHFIVKLFMNLKPTVSNTVNLPEVLCCASIIQNILFSQLVDVHSVGCAIQDSTQEVGTH